MFTHVDAPIAVHYSNIEKVGIPLGEMWKKVRHSE